MKYIQVIPFIFCLLVIVECVAQEKLSTNQTIDQSNELRLLDETLRLIMNNEGKEVDVVSYEKNGLSAWELIYLSDFKNFLEAYVLFDPKSTSERWEQTSKSIDTEITLNESTERSLVFRGEMYLRWGMLYGAIGNTYKAFKFLQKAKYYSYTFHQINAKDPMNNRTIALLHILFSSVPDTYAWVLPLLGLKGDEKEGLRLIRSLVSNQEQHVDATFHRVTNLLYGLSLVHMGTKDKDLWQWVTILDEQSPSNHLLCYISVVKQIRLGRLDIAFDILKAYLVEKGSFSYKPFKLLYARLIRPFSLSASANWYQSVLTQQGDQHLQKTAYFRLALIANAEQKKELALSYLQRVRESDLSCYYDDKVAQQEATYIEEYGFTNSTLCEARILFDAGCYALSNVRLISIDQSKLKTIRDKVTFHYRFGQNYFELNQLDDAIKSFTKACELGKDTDLYVVCKSWLQMARIYQLKKDRHRSVVCAKKALQVNADLFKEALHNQAKQIKKEVE